MNKWIYILIMLPFISCTYAGGKREITQTTDTIMETDTTIDKNSLEYITSILPLYQRVYDPVTGLEMYDDKLMQGEEWPKVLKTADGWIIKIFPSSGRGGGGYQEIPPLPGFYIIQKDFYLDGRLKSIMKMYESMMVDTARFYDKAGNITKEVNYNEFYKDAKIPFEQALQLFDQVGFIDLKTGKGRMEFSIYEGRVTTAGTKAFFDYRIREGIPYWIARDYMGRRLNGYEINALTGEMKKVIYNRSGEE